MAKSLLRSIKDYNSCIGSMIESIDGFTPYPFVTTDAMLQFLKEIASECKNSNMPDMLGTTPMYHAIKSGQVKDFESFAWQMLYKLLKKKATKKL